MQWRGDHPRGLANEAFIRRATTGFDDYRDAVERYTLKYAEQNRCSADVIQRAAHAYARADRAVICWTLGSPSTTMRLITSFR
jgi:formate dehydrogenase major subunit